MCANCCYLGSEFLISRLLAGLVRFAPVLVLLCRFGGKLISESKNNHTEDSRHQWDSVILGFHGLRVNTTMRLSMSMCENKAEKFTQSNIHNTCIGHLFIFRRMPRSPDLLFQSHTPPPTTMPPSTCHTCAAILTTPKLRLQHLKLTGHPTTCPLCDSIPKPPVAQYQDIDTLRHHIRLTHPSLRTCVLCPGGPLFPDDISLRDHHISAHHACARCWVPGLGLMPKFGGFEELREHCLKEHYECEDCWCVMGFESLAELRRHRHVEHGWCMLCGGKGVEVGFRDVEDLRWHMCAAHLACPLCFAVFKSIKALRSHGERDHFACGECTYGGLCRTFETRGKRDAHLRGGCHVWDMEFEDFLQVYPGGFPRGHCDQWGFPGRRNGNPFATRASRAPPPSPEQSPSPPPPPPPPPPRSSQPPPKEDGPVDIYAILGIWPQSSHQEAKQAVRKRRIETHPDKLKRVGMSKDEEKRIDEQAKLVGFAADIVLDKSKREQYDLKTGVWRFGNGQHGSW